MRLSKWVQVDDNILLEYIYDQDNLISERYAVIFNEKTLSPGFASTLSTTKNYADVVVSENSRTLPNTPVNQLVKLNEVDRTYSKFNLSSQSFIQKKDYPPSIPVSYDRVRIHMPVNYVFDNYIKYKSYFFNK